MEVVGLLFFLCAYVCQVAGPSLRSNLTGLLLDGYLSGLAFDLTTKHDILVAPVASDKVRHYLLRVQGLRLGGTSTL